MLSVTEPVTGSFKDATVKKAEGRETEKRQALKY